MRNPLSAFLDPARRPRAIAWSGITLLLLVVFTVAANMVTSTAWFCNDVCHGVHADNKRAYYNASHNKISCMACHYPVGMDPASFMIDRVDKLADIPPAVMGTTHMPVNKFSRVALTMPQTQCTQCHKMANRDVDPSSGIKIDHEVHDQRGITCLACHNRVAHREEGPMTIKGNEKHEDFGTMTACFRCHTLTDESPSEYKAPGECGVCHKKGFDLEPATHDAKNWYDVRGDSSGHAKAAKAMLASTEKASATWEEERAEVENHEPRPLAKLAYKIANYDESLKVKVPPVSTINECGTCHTPKFCNDCHGTKIPHEPDFRAAHSKSYKPKDAASCAKCHNETHQPKFADTSCNQCHHKQWQPTKGTWNAQHGRVIHAEGPGAVKKCESCHARQWCSQCHTAGGRVGY